MNKLTTMLVLFLLTACSGNKENERIDGDDVRHASSLIGLEFTTPEIDSMLDGLEEALDDYGDLRGYPLANNIPPALVFNPLPPGFAVPGARKKSTWDLPGKIELPAVDGALAFFDISSLAALIRTGKITSMDLTRYFIDRLKRYDDSLHCLVTMTEQYALQRAAMMDRELAEGKYRGILHGIPYGIKDLFSFPGYPTTWGAAPFRDQHLGDTAAVIRKLEDAGAVLIGKLTTGALAMGDVWFGGTTRNPWDTRQGSSGSSAGPAAATVAGLVPFAIGTETWGSIVSPSTRCGATGLRPTFGRVSRAGAMALSWSMDKAGPICRSAHDCAIVFNAICGRDENDPATVDAPFNYRKLSDLSELRVGYLKQLFDSGRYFRKFDSLSLETFRKLGADLIPVSLPDSIPVDALSIILSAEAASAFDELTRDNLDDSLVRQGKNAWPNYFRTARFIPAVEYIRANRIRTLLIAELNDVFSGFDVVIAPTFGGSQLLMTNLTGHPCLVMPEGFTKENRPGSISLLGNLFDEATLLAVGELYQDATDFEDSHPPHFTSN